MSLLPREWNTKDTSSEQLTVFQWNCLADWASYAFPKVDHEFLAWDYRKPLIVAEAQRTSPDIICLQEVDQFDQIEAELTSEYTGRFLPKPGRSSDRADGVAIFWKTGKLTAKATHELKFADVCQDADMKQVALAVDFTTNDRGESVQAATTHLKAKADFEESRAKQGAALAEFLKRLPSAQLSLVCGDFNTDERSAAVTVLKQQCQLASAYREQLGAGSDEGDFPSWTTWKIRDKVKKCTIDFVLYRSDTWRLNDVWDVPAESDVDAAIALPCERYPSDHCSLAARFVSRDA